MRAAAPYAWLARADFDDALAFVATGGYALRAYERFAKIVRDFIRTTEPSHYDRDHWRDLLDEGAPRRPADARAGEAPVSPLDDVRRATPA